MTHKSLLEATGSERTLVSAIGGPACRCDILDVALLVAAGSRSCQLMLLACLDKSGTHELDDSESGTALLMVSFAFAFLSPPAIETACAREKVKLKWTDGQR